MNKNSDEKRISTISIGEKENTSINRKKNTSDGKISRDNNKKKNTEEIVYENISKLLLLVYKREFKERKVYYINLL